MKRALSLVKFLLESAAGGAGGGAVAGTARFSPAGTAFSMGMAVDFSRRA